MSQFLFLLISGVLWLLVVLAAPHLGLDPQWVSLLRGAYLGMFSIALVVDLRRADDRIAHDPTASWFYLIPIVSLGLYNLFGAESGATWRQVAILGSFLVVLMMLVRLRELRGGMKTGWWELLPPPLLMLALFFAPYAWPIFVILIILLLAQDLRKLRDVKSASFDAVIMQLPSFCLAPVVLVLARDGVTLSPDVSRSTVEVMGLVINGIGGALWTALVMRGRERLAALSVVMWGAGLIGALVATVSGMVTPVPIFQIVVLLGVFEALRGSLWLLTTHFLTYMPRWRAAAVNLAATLLPFIGALVMHRIHSDGLGAVAYALIAAPMFLLLFAETRRARKRASLSLP